MQGTISSSGIMRPCCLTLWALRASALLLEYSQASHLYILEVPWPCTLVWWSFSAAADWKGSWSHRLQLKPDPCLDTLWFWSSLLLANDWSHWSHLYLFSAGGCAWEEGGWEEGAPGPEVRLDAGVNFVKSPEVIALFICTWSWSKYNFTLVAPSLPNLY